MNADKKRDVSAAEAATLSQAICRMCGLCCDGTLFSFARLRPEEDIVQLKKVGITTICDDGKTFTLPCASFDQICTIYDACRAKVCGGFICQLLKNYSKSRISYEDAADIIRQAHALKDKAHASLLAAGGNNIGGLREQYLNLSGAKTEVKSREHVIAEFNYSVLQLQLNRHFRIKKKQVTSQK